MWKHDARRAECFHTISSFSNFQTSYGRWGGGGGVAPVTFLSFKISIQDACSGVHSACRAENRRKVGIYVQLLRQGTWKVAI